MDSNKEPRSLITAQQKENDFKNADKIIICRNAEFKNKKLTDCSDEYNEYIMTFEKNSEGYNEVNSMFEGADDMKSGIETANFEGHLYKAILKDENDNIISGVTLGCRKVYYKKDSKIYKIITNDECATYSKSLYQMITSNDAGFDKMLEFIKDYNIADAVLDEENQY